MLLFLCLALLPLASSFAFAPSPRPSMALRVDIAEVDATGNNIIVKKTLAQASESGLLTSVYKSGLLSKAKAAGVTLTSLEPLLKLASENPDVLLLVESAGPDVLPLLPTIVGVAPGALPILGALIQVPPALIGALGLASPAAAFAVVQAIPDDSSVSIAVQTLAVGVLGLAVPAISLVGAKVLGDLTK